MTKQEIFDKNVKWFFGRKKRGPAMTKHGFCAYYDPDTGNRCAVGCAIPAKMAKKMADDIGTITDIFDMRREARQVFRKSQLPFLEQLQTAHDSSADVKAGSAGFHDRYKKLLKKLAADYKLKIPADWKEAI